MTALKITANDVADYIIKFCHQHGDCLTNLKIQKLVYYTQAWYLALYDKPLFDDEIQAWVHGPVVPLLYKRFKKYKFNDIKENPDSINLPRKVEGHIKEVLQVYGGYSAYQLELMTHNETPWKNARRGYYDDKTCAEKIDLKDMKSFYKEHAAK
jgi:uncharacterized phage-associated protein